MNRTTLSLIGAAAGLVAVTGVAALTAPSSSSADGGGRSGGAAASAPVERSTLACPSPTSSEVGETTYTGYTPGARGAAGWGTARLLPLGAPPGDGGRGGRASGGAVVPLTEPGKPVTATVNRSDAPALAGTADGGLAPGWTVQQTTRVDAGSGRGLQGLTCAPPDTEFWFPGASTAAARQDYAHLTNPDDRPAVVDLELYGADGRLDTPTGESVTVPARSSVPVLLSTLTTERTADLTLHVLARAGRVAAAVQAADARQGGDWLTASAAPATGAVLPGIPADATSVRLVLFAPRAADADLKVRLAGPTGSFTPAGHGTVHVKSGMTTAVDLGDVTRGEAGSLVLTPDAGEGAAGQVVAALQVTRGRPGRQETAFIPAAAPVERRATAADNRAAGGSALSLAAPERSATVRVTASEGSAGGTAVSRTYTVKAGATLAVAPPRPASGRGAYALTVERIAGGPLYASRTLAESHGGVPMFTVQTLPDDRGTVAVPDTERDLSLLLDATDD
ncbi:DUF5719 family protein [Streptomyces sp. B1866]|uniref:DUF5719 family protein n=1 Tax=Streptomyces sp. B1866 TaxID=3075431 RepID=UPI0028915D9D|nr:DUF5719 family protein [Streptomyces sp. B1866]MDT3398893.1 DUF5719 family protein [Streptomyces sp. B1866]